MRPFLICLLLATLAVSCETGEDSGEEMVTTDTINDNLPNTIDNTSADIDTTNTELFSNQYFSNVSVKKIGENIYSITGIAANPSAQIFYDVEDGHNVLADGLAPTDGAGKFNFTVEVEKEMPNSTLMLVLYEKDASAGRRNELPIALPADQPI